MEKVFIGMAKAPKSHQAIIKDLIAGLNNDLDSEYIVLPEPNLYDDIQDTLQPDLLISEIDSEKNIIAIEITNKQAKNKTIEKCLQYIKNKDVKEAFTIVYTPTSTFTYNILEIIRINNKGEEKESESEILEFDLYDYID